MAKAKSNQPSAAPITFLNVPLEADAYYVNADMTDSERLRLKMSWEQMNKALDRKRVLLILPADTTLKQMPSEVLFQWMDKCSGILKERGHAVPSV